MVRLQPDDGREVFASPGHPTADGRRLRQLHRGDALDDAHVLSAKRIRYECVPSVGRRAFEKKSE
jgi:hypothetical protein